MILVQSVLGAECGCPANNVNCLLNRKVANWNEKPWLQTKNMAMEKELLEWLQRHLFSTESLATTWMIIVAAAMVDTLLHSCREF